MYYINLLNSLNRIIFGIIYYASCIFRCVLIKGSLNSFAYTAYNELQTLR